MKRFLKLMAALVAAALTTNCDLLKSVVKSDEAKLVDPIAQAKTEYFFSHWSEYLVPGSWAFLLLALLMYHYISLSGKKARSLRSMPFWFVVSLGLSLLLFHFVDESLGWMIPLMLILMIRYQPPELTSLAEKKGWKAFLTLRYWPKKPPETSATPPAQPNVPATALPTATLPPDPASACPSCGGYLGPKICTAGCGYRRPTTPPAGSAPTTTSASGTSPNNLESALDLLWRRKNR